MNLPVAVNAGRTAFTPVGWLVLAEAAILLSSRWWPARTIPEPTTVALGLALLAVLAVAWWRAPRLVLRAEARWLIAPRLPMGEEVTVGAVLEIPDGLPPCAIEALDPGTRRRDQAVRLKALSAGSYRPTWTARFPRRGLVHLPPLALRCAQPFGVVETVRELGPGYEVTVLPAVGQVRRELRERLDSWLSDMMPVAEAGVDEFDHLRAYRPGDARHAIHWRATARHRELLVAERRDPACRRLAVVLDTGGFGPGGALPPRSFEKLVCAAATLVAACLDRGWQVAIHGGFAPTGITGDVDRLLEALALATMDGAPIAECLPTQGAVAVLTARPGDVPHADQPPLVVPLEELDGLFRLPARLR